MKKSRTKIKKENIERDKEYMRINKLKQEANQYRCSLVSFDNIKFVSLDIHHFSRFVECIFKNVDFSNLDILMISNTIFSKCYFINCNFKNSRFTNDELLNDNTFYNCTGLNFACPKKGVDFYAFIPIIARFGLIKKYEKPMILKVYVEESADRSSDLYYDYAVCSNCIVVSFCDTSGILYDKYSIMCYECMNIIADKTFHKMKLYQYIDSSSHTGCESLKQICMDFSKAVEFATKFE